MVDWGDLPGWGGLILSGAALGISVLASRSSEKSRKAYEDLERRWRHDLDQHGQTHELAALMKVWGGRALHVISKMQVLLPERRVKAAGQTSDHIHLLAELSALIDEGRWSFPNRSYQEYGLHKEYAYVGIREPLLDALVYMHDIFRDGSLFGAPADIDDFIDLRRAFVSEMLLKTNPERLSLEEIKAIKDRSAQESPILARAKRYFEGERGQRS